jgi:hypothetical protein
MMDGVGYREIARILVLTHICKECSLEEIDRALVSKDPVVKLEGKRRTLWRKKYYVKHEDLKDIRNAKATGYWRTLEKSLTGT